MSDETNLRKILEKLEEEHRIRTLLIRNNYDLFQDILASMPKDSVTRAWVDLYDFNLAVAGNRPILVETIRALRSHGYSATEKPMAGKPSYSAYFRCEGKPTIWLNFTSTQCRRVKVGTQTVVQDVYETVCDEQIYESAGAS